VIRLNEIEHKIALIANPHLGYPVENIDLEGPTLEFIESNKLSLLLKKKGIEIETAKREEERHKYLMDELCELKHAFDDYGVDFVLIKFPELPRPHGDLDVLLCKDVKSAEHLLKSKGYILDNDRDPYRKKYVKSVNGTTWEVDLHLEAAWGGIVYLNKEEVWKYCIKREINGVDIPVPSPEYEVLIAAAHGMRENKITLFDVLYVYSLLKEKKVDMDFIRDVAKRNNWVKQLDYFIHLINRIYGELYDESGNHSRIKELPFRFPVYTIGKLKLQKAILDLRYCGIRRGIKDLKALCYFDGAGFLKRIRR